jgi:WD40 repeat protein
MSILIERILAASPTTTRGQPTQLSADSKGERIAYAVCISLLYLDVGDANVFSKSGKSIFVRSIDNPSISKQYTAHTAQTTVARFSPSGYYVASGDVSGSVRVWDAMEAVNTKGS